MINGDQIRMARAALKIGVRDLAEMAGVNPGTISRFETGKGGMQANTLDTVQKALQGAGIIFIEDGEASTNGGPGIRMKEK
ncbi:helix-turn-helix domain-containing protein [Terasakiella pusilla]|uniref:helix-turn-helix domain-containing protein n=1 Tax=Terasakiella pusilla TaxID=64973 RepID=UPI003AA9B50F